MSLRLPRFLRSIPLVESNGTPTLAFHQWWDTTLKQIEASVQRIELSLAAAGVALDRGGVLPPMGVRTVTVSDAVNGNDTLIIADATAGDIVVSLPPAATKQGLEVIVKKISSPPRIVTVQANGAEEIDGAPNVSLTVQYEAVHLVSDGTAWWSI